MRFIVLSRPEAEKYKPEVSAIIISITDPEQPQAALRNILEYKDCLRLQFHDLDHPIEGYKYLKMFHKTDAEQIIAFVDKYKDGVELVVVHCEAGVSRSAGVAAALSVIYNNTCEEFYSSRYYPNALVKSVILRVAGLYGDLE